MYTCYKGGERAKFGMHGQDDGFIYAALQEVKAAGDALAIVHCENDDIVSRETRRLSSVPPQDLSDLALWERARPEIAEVEAVRRIITFAEWTGCPVVIAHISSHQVLEAVARCKAAGLQVFAETLVGYLCLDTDAAAGRFATVNPPIRPAGNAAYLWDAIRSGTIDFVATDHCPTPLDLKGGPNVLACASGHPGLETMLPGLLSYGVNGGRITLGGIAQLQARAASVFGLAQKGAIVPGADADLVLVDLDIANVVKGEAMQSTAKYSPFEGVSLRGWPVWTMVRGAIVARDGRVVGKAGTGRYVRASNQD